MAKVDKGIWAGNAAWSFEGIADEFDEHVARSVPLYHEGHELVCQVSDFFLPKDAVVTEIGCATGVLGAQLLAHHAGRADISYIGIDPVASMVDKAAARCAADPRARFLVEDVVSYALEPSSLIVSYYTLQFVHPKNRQAVFDKIYRALEWGGAFVLFEKVRGPDARFQDIMTQIYQEYKLCRNFTEEEILHKARSLKGILEPFSTQGNLDLMKRAGFTDITSIMKWVCFEGFLAIK
jgi:tRNA (cmo5U34)-methyltransferase